MKSKKVAIYLYLFTLILVIMCESSIRLHSVVNFYEIESIVMTRGFNKMKKSNRSLLSKY